MSTIKELSPLISVVIPTYNREEYIMRACETVLSQTYSNLEIIVVDDNSDQDYIDFLEAIKSYQNIRYIRRNDNGGGSAARNTGVEHAKGEYIAFLDDDDVWLEDKIKLQYESLSNNIKASHCGYLLKSNNKERIEPFDVISQADLCVNNKLASTSGLLCSKNILINVKFDESLHRSQDWDLYLRIAECTDFSYVRKALYIYDDGDHARMSNKYSSLTIAEYEKRLDMLEKHRSLIGERSYTMHVAGLILPSLLSRKDKINIIAFCSSKIGVLNTFYYLLKFFYKKIRLSK